MKARLLIGLAVLSLAGCLWGCAIHTRNNGEVGVRWGTEITFFHRTADTKSTAEIGTTVPGFREWAFETTEETGATPGCLCPVPIAPTAAQHGYVEEKKTP